MTGAEYQQFLATKVYPDMTEKYGEGWIFQQDGDGSHSAKVVRDWLDQQPQRWIPDWPALSPDISWVENLWAIIGQRMEGAKIRTADGLWKRLQKEWNSIGREIYRKLADSMPRRLELVVEANGGPINY
jgi:hypothetical protein